MRDARIDLRLPHAQKARWVQEAEERKLDLSEMIRRSVERDLKAKQKRQPKVAIG